MYNTLIEPKPNQGVIFLRIKNSCGSQDHLNQAHDKGDASMADIKGLLEKIFERFTKHIYTNPKKTLLVMLIFVTALLSNLPHIKIDTSTEGFLHEKDPVLQKYYDFRDQFGRDEMIVVAVEADKIFTLSFLKKLQRLHLDLEKNVPHIAKVTSLINARDTRGTEKELIVEDFLENFPETEKAVKAIKKRALSNPMYENMILSVDGRFTTVILETNNYTGQDSDMDLLSGFDGDMAVSLQESEKPEYLTDKENSEAVQGVQKVVEAHRAPGFKIHIAGSPVVTDYLKKSMLRDMKKFLGLAVFTVAIFLFIMFRRISAVILPLAVVMLALLSTVASMAAAGIALKLPTQILPSFLLAVGVGDSVHILAIFFQKFSRTGNKESSMIYALGHSGMPVLLTSLTTAAGLISFSAADIAPIADLGIFASAGVIFAFVYTVILIPAMISITPLKNHAGHMDDNRKTGWNDKILDRIAGISTTHPVAILIISFIILGISVAGITRIKFSHDIVSWFPEMSDVRIATETIDKNMKGSVSLEIIIDTKQENGLYDPELLKKIDESADYIESFEMGEIFVGKAWSLPVVLKEIHKALNEDKNTFYTIPDDKTLIAQEFLLFENSGSDDLEDFTDSLFSKARFTVKLPFKDAVLYTKFLKKIKTHFEKTYPELDIAYTGMVSILFQTLTSVITSMAKSYVLAFLVITILMVFLFGKIRTGLLSMIPNLAPIIVIMGIMGWFNISLDLFTMLIGSIALGLAVDDTVHFMYNFQRSYLISKDAKKAVFETLHTTGNAMLITTCVLSIGFFIFMFASMNNLFNFGILTGTTIIMALLADYFIAPALMVLVNKN